MDAMVQRFRELLLQLIMAVSTTGAAYFFYRWYKVRMRFRKFKAMGPVNNFFVTMLGLFINAAAYDVALVALGSLGEGL